jgi:asparagine synthase (glutamine-hydrolysing)
LCQANGHGVLFSGFGGDEAVTYFGGMPARYELFDQRNWLALWRSFGGAIPMKAARMAKTLSMALRKMPDNDAGMRACWAARWPWQFLRRETLDAFNLEQDYYATATYDEKFRTINDAVRHLISRPYAPIRLDNCTLMSASYGIDYVWPLWDQRLVQQWLSTPAIWKIGNNGMNRFLHRKAVSGVSADIVAWKPEKDMGLAGSMQVAENHDNRKMLNDLLALLENLKPGLIDLVDVERLRAMALRDIAENKTGAEYSWTMSRNIERLETLNMWNQ